ncbi:hypothetical protein PAAG_05344 [Paracoccidioides lutzii Pb01]|uniref:DUF1330 domain-containing protein n=1 Tax=Paracoccidioides lutzii (strain ATCC MYA-826 / Pb01) TaxID=502779 RepID=C1H3K1_PARBA|nr:hypothetical protein PAAG_05344 [Paracoccidioides lutzii Pb01]EEH34295.1 hypothetical protein PAAG_05344 [Paracoccidioides lutzii Pb01]
MPLLTLHLLTLSPNTNPKTFIEELKKSPGVEVIVCSRPRHVVVRSHILDGNPLQITNWDLLILLLSPRNAIPSHLRDSYVKSEYSIQAGIPSKLLSTFADRDAKLKCETSSIPTTGALDIADGKASSQSLELSPDLLKFMDELLKTHDKPVTMLNLLHFHPCGKQEYFKYGQGFVKVASKIGGDAKLVGNVVHPAADQRDSRGNPDRPEEDWWNEISIVHYPSIRHFCDMLASEEYQEINTKHRLNALKDTFLLCTTEFDVEDGGIPAKL